MPYSLPLLIPSATLLTALVNPCIGARFRPALSVSSAPSSPSARGLQRLGLAAQSTNSLVALYRIVGALLIVLHVAAGEFALGGGAFAAQAHAAVLYIFTSCCSMLLMSLSWGHASELFTAEQSLRLFGTLAAGCTVGQLVGSTVVMGMLRIVAAPAC